MAIPRPFHLMQWIDEHRDHFRPPVMNKQFFVEASDVVVFVSVGPNRRNDYHVNPTEELFYQLRGDIAVRVRPLDGSPAHDVVVREGEIWLCPRNVPHRPQRPAETVGLVVEFPRPAGSREFLRWYCPDDIHLVHEAEFRLKHIDEDLHRIMDEFWNGPESIRTCRETGKVIQRAQPFEFST